MTAAVAVATKSKRGSEKGSRRCPACGRDTRPRELRTVFVRVRCDIISSDVLRVNDVEEARKIVNGECRSRGQNRCDGCVYRSTPLRFYSV